MNILQNLLNDIQYRCEIDMLINEDDVGIGKLL